MGRAHIMVAWRVGCDSPSKYKIIPAEMITIPWPLPHISLVTDPILDALRQEPKKKASGSREKTKMGHIERQYEIVSAENTDRRYRLFLRRSATNSDVFSAGLTLILPGDDLILCRYNSGHHGHKNILERHKIPSTYHQHITTHRYIVEGLDHSGYAIARTEYNTLDGALALLTQECNIEGIFKTTPQQNLF